MTKEKVKSWIGQTAQLVGLITVAAPAVFWLAHSCGYSLGVPAEAMQRTNARIDNHDTRIQRVEIWRDSTASALEVLTYLACADRAKQGDMVLPPLCNRLLGGRR